MNILKTKAPDYAAIAAELLASRDTIVQILDNRVAKLKRKINALKAPDPATLATLRSKLDKALETKAQVASPPICEKIAYNIVRLTAIALRGETTALPPVPFPIYIESTPQGVVARVTLIAQGFLDSMGSDPYAQECLEIGEGGNKICLLGDHYVNEGLTVRLVPKAVSSIDQITGENRIRRILDADPFLSTAFPSQDTELVLKYYPQTLYDNIHTQQKLTPRQAIQLVEGVTRIHKNGVALVDLKEANILLDEEGNLKLTDFGSSLVRSNLSPRHLRNIANLLPTPNSSSPESIAAKLQPSPTVPIEICKDLNLSAGLSLQEREITSTFYLALKLDAFCLGLILWRGLITKSSSNIIQSLCPARLLDIVKILHNTPKNQKGPLFEEAAPLLAEFQRTYKAWWVTETSQPNLPPLNRAILHLLNPDWQTRAHVGQIGHQIVDALNRLLA